MGSNELLTTDIIGISGVSIKDVAVILKQTNQLAKTYGVHLQLVDADKITGEAHLQIASYHAQKSFRQDTATSNSIGLEILLYATGQRQIAKALALMGISIQTKNIAVVILSPPHFNKHSELIQKIELILNGIQSINVFILTPNKEQAIIQLFNITTTELQITSITDLVIERIAILELTKKPPIDLSKI